MKLISIIICFIINLNGFIWADDSTTTTSTSGPISYSLKSFEDMFNAYIDRVAPAFENLATNITKTTKSFRKMTNPEVAHNFKNLMALYPPLYNLIEKQTEIQISNLKTSQPSNVEPVILFDQSDFDEIIGQLQGTGQVAGNAVDTFVEYTYLVESIFSGGPDASINSTILEMSLTAADNLNQINLKAANENQQIANNYGNIVKLNESRLEEYQTNSDAKNFIKAFFNYASSASGLFSSITENWQVASKTFTGQSVWDFTAKKFILKSSIFITILEDNREVLGGFYYKLGEVLFAFQKAYTDYKSS